MKIQKTFKLILFFIFFLILSSFAESVEIRIIHINDFHGFAESYRPFGSEKLLGGASYLAESVKRLRSEKPSILISAGDMIQGNNWTNLTEGKSVIELMNAMEFDAMVIGNHELDFGQEVFAKRASEAKFPILGANVQGLNFLKPFVIKELAGIKLAIIGVTTEDTPSATHPKNVEGLNFLPVESTVMKYIDQLRGEVDLFIVLSHIGFHADRLLAEKVKEIDVIVGGHSHTKIDKPAVVGKTIIVQAWEHGKALGVLDLKIENSKIVKFEVYLIEITPELSSYDASIKAIVDKYSKMVDVLLDEKIGIALNDLDGENVRKKETNFGNFVADVIREKAAADIAIINGGGIRTGIKKGEIKIKDIYSALPFNNYIVAIRMTGKQINEAIEHGVSAVEEGAGRFPQISGIKFFFDSKALVGNRVKAIFIEDEPLEPDREYIVATNDFLVAGGDGYTVFAKVLKSSADSDVTDGAIKAEKLVYSDYSKYIRDVVVDYIKKKGIIDPKVEGRIREDSKNESLCK